MSALKRIMAILLVLCLAVSVSACGGNSEGETTTGSEDLTSETSTDSLSASATDSTTLPSDVEPVTDVNGEPVTDAEGETIAAIATTAAPVQPVTPEEVLAAYTAVMNKVKTSKPEFYSYEYQDLPKDKRNFEGFMMKLILPLASLFMTSKDDVIENPAHNDKGEEAYWFPVYKTDYGCLLTDATKLKTAKCDVLANGNYKLTLVLKDEMNPEPCEEGGSVSPSYTGAMFAPMKASDITDTIENDSRINKLVKLNSYSLRYYDCTAIVVYDPQTLQISTVDNQMHILVTLDGKVGFSSVKGNAVLDDIARFYDFSY